ncbi:MAG: LacI family DNA-binding transcriptional regulator [Actinomycetota bacterium]
MNKRVKNPSIKDIAREAGVAISTVSNVINKKGVVGKETEKKVLKALEKIKYRPNIIARGLRTRSTNTIGIIVQDIANPHTSHVIKGMEEVARNRGYTLLIACTFYDMREEEMQVDVFLDQFIDGFIFLGGYDNRQFVREIYEMGIPLVLVDREISDTDIPSVLIDNKEAMEKAVDYLYSFGHRKIGYVTFKFEEQTTARNRYLGYCSGLEKNNLEYDPRVVVIDDYMKLNETGGTFEIIMKFLKEGVPPTAFATISDVNAFGLVKALKSEGIRIPEEVSVIGFDNIFFSNFLEPPLTTIKQPKKLMGQTAMNLLLDLVEKRKVEQRNIKLATILVERDSVGPPP